MRTSEWSSDANALWAYRRRTERYEAGLRAERTIVCATLTLAGMLSGLLATYYSRVEVGPGHVHHVNFGSYMLHVSGECLAPRRFLPFPMEWLGACRAMKSCRALGVAPYGLDLEVEHMCNLYVDLER